MFEEVITIKAPVSLEGLLTKGLGTSGVVLTHPHPLYGGEMNNPVVKCVAKVFQAAGWSTLRFNFRGVGASQGRYDEGRGEVDDLLAAVAYLRTQGVGEIYLAGYSFGAWIIYQAIAADRISGLGIIMVAPPVAMMDFSATIKLPDLWLVVAGENDEIAPPYQVKPLTHAWNPQAHFSEIPNADHFFNGCQKSLALAIKPLL
ncbi:MAG: alpha/beta fold hydrolase [Deltaproteobacteria bacterium]|nr:alpha/beta fold hydrolase [Deltaproteobacteria bacterium]